MPAQPRIGARRWLIRLAAFGLLVAAFFAGLIVLAHWAREQLRERDKYTLPLADVECSPPPGMTRGEFLDEVQYLASFSGRLCVLDEDLSARLSAAFAKHPWVRKVDEVSVTPPRRVQVRLTYRRAVLVVRDRETLRAVDADGILLPRQAPTTGLPRYSGEAASPRGPAGTRWGDTGVEAAAAKLR